MHLLRHVGEGANPWLRGGQRLALFAQGFCYGSNDAQSMMGLLCGAWISASLLALPASKEAFSVPLWMRFVLGSALTLGAFIGSDATLRTEARRLFKLRNTEGLAAQAGTAISVYSMVMSGAPISSTLVLSSALIGSGAAKKPGHVHWDEAGKLLLTWVITFPCAFVVAVIIELILGMMIS
jgi:PiT family inorganic phosphate transporter